MRKEYVAELLRSFFAVAILIIGAAAIALTSEPASAGTQSKDISFSLNRLPENASKYSLVISDDAERSISGEFSVDQLQILRAMMVEAEKFALSGEAVGDKEPITTRFADRQEQAFIVDVQKAGNQSLLFLTLKTPIGRTTIESGRTLRATRREQGFFFDLLSRLESMLPKLPTQSSK